MGGLTLLRRRRYLQGPLAVAPGVISLDGTPTTAFDATGLVNSIQITTPNALANSVLVFGMEIRTPGLSSHVVTNPAETLTAPGGDFADFGAANGAQMHVAAKVAIGGPETLTFNVADAPTKPDSIVIVCQAYKGVNVASIWQDGIGRAEPSAVAVGLHTTDVLTPDADGRWPVAIFGERNSASWTPTAPLIERIDQSSGAGNHADIELCDIGTAAVNGTPVSYSSTSSVTTTVATMWLGLLKAA